MSREGKLDEARRLLDEMRRHVSALNLKKVDETQRLGGGEQRLLAARADMLAALRAAGLE